MPLVLITVGLIAQELAPNGNLHTFGVIDVFVGAAWLIVAIFVWVLALAARA
jgi:hypothetical protein